MNTKRSMARHTNIKMSKSNGLKAPRLKWFVRQEGTFIRLISYFFAETLQAYNEWKDIFKVVKEIQTKILYPANDPSKVKGRYGNNDTHL